MYFAYLSEHTIHHIDDMGNEYAYYALPEGMVVQQIEAVANLDIAYLLASESADQGMAVYVSNKYQTERMVVEGFDNHDLSAIAVYGDYLYAYSASNNLLSTINISSIITPTLACPPVTVTGIRYMTGAHNGYVYALMEGDGNHIWLVNLQTGETEMVNYTLPATVSACAAPAPASSPPISTAHRFTHSD